MKQIIWLALIFSTFQAWSSEHCLLYPVSLEERVRMADLIVEAEVVHDSVFAIQSPYMIRTAYTLRIIGVLKGMTMENTKMIVDGGVLGDRALIVRPSVNPAIGSRGVFLLRRFGNHHEPFAGPQSMILLDDVGRYCHPF